MTDTNDKPAIQGAIKGKSVKKSLLVRASLFLIFALGVIFLTLGTVKYLNSTIDDSLLDRLPQIPPEAAKNKLLTKAIAKADSDLRHAFLSDQSHRAFGQKAGRLGELYHGNDFYPEALACYKIAMEYDTQNPLWPHHIAMLRQTMGKTHSAVDLLKRTIQLQPDYLPAMLKLADIYYKMRKNDLADVYYKRSLHLDHGDKYALLGLSRIALDSSKWKQAQLYLEKTIRSAPNFGTAHRLLASVHKHFGRTELMVRSLEKAEELKKIRFPIAPDPWIQQVNLLSYDVDKLISLGDKARQMYYIQLSQKYFRRALMFDHDDPDPFFKIGMMAFDSGLKKESLPFFSKAIRIDPNYVKAYNKLGSILLSEQKAEEAERMFLKSLQCNPENAYSYDGLGGSQFQQGKYEDALLSFTRALKIDPDVKSLNYHLASTLHKLGRIDQAVNYYKEQLKLQPEHKDTRLHLARIFLEKNQVPSALKQYYFLLEAKPDSVKILNAIAWTLATTEDKESKDPPHAVKLAKRACDISNYKRPMIIDTLAVAYAADGQFQQAAETAQRALALARLSGKQALAKNIQKRLELYKNNQPYRVFQD